MSEEDQYFQNGIFFRVSPGSQPHPCGLAGTRRVIYNLTNTKITSQMPLYVVATEGNLTLTDICY